MRGQREVDLWCPGAVASAVHITPSGSLFKATVAVTVRLELDPSRPHLVADRYLENVMHVSMDELTGWPFAEETVKRSDGVRVKLPKVDARLRIHRVEGPREPLQDVPFEMDALAIDRDKRLADVGLRAELTISDPAAKLVALVGVALGSRAIEWPSRDQVVAERALSGSHLFSTVAMDRDGVDRAPAPLPITTTKRGIGASPVASTAATALAAPSTPPRRGGTRPPPPPKRLPKPAIPLAPPNPPPALAHGAAPVFSPPAPPRQEPSGAVTLDPDEALTLDPDAPELVSIPLDGTVIIGGSEPSPPSQRMALTVDNRTALAAWTVPWQLMGKHSLTVVLKATCDIGADGTRLRETTAAPAGDVFHDGDPAGTLIHPSDHALLKHRADVLLIGHAYAPAGRASRSTLTFRFGAGDNRFERRLAVFGAREWRDGVPSPPMLFRSVPLIYERAFGGPGFAKNPVGVGYGDSHRGAFAPSLEEAAHPLTRRGEERRPACTAAISPTWEARWKRVGKTWRGRLDEKWDALPDDFNWEYFQCAPREQQLDYLSGSEPFEILGARPGDEPLRGRLPAIRPICTVTGQHGARPVTVSIDTVIIDAEQKLLHILWRGLLTVSAPHAPELTALTVTQ